MRQGALSNDVTLLLRAWGEGDAQALDRLAPLVFRELHRIARSYMAHERIDHTLQTTALVNEAYVRLVDARQVTWHDRAHFYAVCARAMRRIRWIFRPRQSPKPDNLPNQYRQDGFCFCGGLGPYSVC